MEKRNTTFDHKYLKIEPSIFAADFGKLADEAKRIEDAGADALHFDIMDGHFVPNITLGPKALGAVNKATNLFLDVHIMVYHPFQYIEELIANGADQITFHLESTEDVEEIIAFIRRCGKKVGLALSPETSLAMVMNYLDKCDMILLMTVNPGFGGQSFIPKVLEKISILRDVCNRLQVKKNGLILEKHAATKEQKSLPPFDIQVDGGINLETAKRCVESGANVLVSGTYLFNGNMASKISSLRNL
ncbi:MAG: ribulose-phosphate 3-epimerase [Chlamydiales bacterium]|nr:ribulose-phosphate 3-epimerase [Chlamydiales bacterium]